MTSREEAKAQWDSLGILSCSKCSLKTSDKGLFTHHLCRSKPQQTTPTPVTAAIRYISEVLLFHCSLCNVKLSESEFIEHLQGHLFMTPYICLFCNAEFRTRNKTSLHMYKFHPSNSRDPKFQLKFDPKSNKLIDEAKSSPKKTAFYTPVNPDVVQIDLDPPNVNKTSLPVNASEGIAQISKVPISKPVALTVSKSSTSRNIDYVVVCLPVAVPVTSLGQMTLACDNATPVSCSRSGLPSGTSNTLQHTLGRNVGHSQSSGSQKRGTNSVVQVSSSLCGSTLGQYVQKCSSQSVTTAPPALPTPQSQRFTTEHSRPSHVQPNQSHFTRQGVFGNLNQNVSLQVTPTTIHNHQPLMRQTSNAPSTLSPSSKSFTAVVVSAEHVSSMLTKSRQKETNINKSKNALVRPNFSTDDSEIQTGLLSAATSSTTLVNCPSSSKASDQQRNVNNDAMNISMHHTNPVQQCESERTVVRSAPIVPATQVSQTHSSDNYTAASGLEVNVAPISIKPLLLSGNEEQKSSGASSAIDMRTIERNLKIMRGFYLCIGCKQKWVDFIPFLSHIWSRHHGLDDRECECSFRSLPKEKPCMRFVDILKFLFLNSCKPMPKTVQKYIDGNGSLTDIESTKEEDIKKEMGMNLEIGLCSPQNQVKSQPNQDANSNVLESDLGTSRHERKQHQHLTTVDVIGSKDQPEQFASIRAELPKDNDLELSYPVLGTPQPENCKDTETAHAQNENYNASVQDTEVATKPTLVAREGNANNSESSIGSCVTNQTLSVNIQNSSTERTQNTKTLQHPVTVNTETIDIESTFANCRSQNQEMPSSHDFAALDLGFFQCSFSGCTFSCHLAENFLKHNTSNHRKETEFTCCYCGHTEVSTESLTHHMGEHVTSSKDKAVQFSCTVTEDSGSAVFHNQSVPKLLKILDACFDDAHSEDKIFSIQCNNCGQKFKNCKDIGYHFTAKSLELTFVKCRYCPGHFLNSQACLKHIHLMHPNSGRYVCVNRKIICFLGDENSCAFKNFQNFAQKLKEDQFSTSVKPVAVNAACAVPEKMNQDASEVIQLWNEQDKDSQGLTLPQTASIAPAPRQETNRNSLVDAVSDNESLSSMHETVETSCPKKAGHRSDDLEEVDQNYSSKGNGKQYNKQITEGENCLVHSMSKSQPTSDSDSLLCVSTSVASSLDQMSTSKCSQKMEAMPQAIISQTVETQISKEDPQSTSPLKDLTKTNVPVTNSLGKIRRPASECLQNKETIPTAVCSRAAGVKISKEDPQLASTSKVLEKMQIVGVSHIPGPDTEKGPLTLPGISRGARVEDSPGSYDAQDNILVNTRAEDSRTNSNVFFISKNEYRKDVGTEEREGRNPCQMQRLNPSSTGTNTDDLHSKKRSCEGDESADKDISAGTLNVIRNSTTVIEEVNKQSTTSNVDENRTPDSKDGKNGSENTNNNNVIRQHDERLYDICGSAEIDSILKPLYVQDQGNRFVCNNCHKRFPSLKVTHCHIFHCQGGIGVVACPHCRTDFSRPKLARNHNAAVHASKNSQETLFYLVDKSHLLLTLSESNLQVGTFRSVCERLKDKVDNQSTRIVMNLSDAESHSICNVEEREIHSNDEMITKKRTSEKQLPVIQQSERQQPGEVAENTVLVASKTKVAPSFKKKKEVQSISLNSDHPTNCLVTSEQKEILALAAESSNTLLAKKQKADYETTNASQLQSQDEEKQTREETKNPVENDGLSSSKLFDEIHKPLNTRLSNNADLNRTQDNNEGTVSSGKNPVPRSGLLGKRTKTYEEESNETKRRKCIVEFIGRKENQISISSTLNDLDEACVESLQEEEDASARKCTPNEGYNKHSSSTEISSVTDSNTFVEEGSVFTCSACSFHSYSYTEMKKHRKAKHIGEHCQIRRAKRLPHFHRCRLCNLTAEMSLSFRKKHFEDNHKEYKICGYCGNIFGFSKILLKHQKFVHRGKKEKVDKLTFEGAFEFLGPTEANSQRKLSKKDTVNENGCGLSSEVIDLTVTDDSVKPLGRSKFPNGECIQIYDEDEFESIATNNQESLSSKSIVQEEVPQCIVREANNIEENPNLACSTSVSAAEENEERAKNPNLACSTSESGAEKEKREDNHNSACSTSTSLSVSAAKEEKKKETIVSFVSFSNSMALLKESYFPTIVEEQRPIHASFPKCTVPPAQSSQSLLRCQLRVEEEEKSTKTGARESSNALDNQWSPQHSGPDRDMLTNMEKSFEFSSRSSVSSPQTFMNVEKIDSEKSCVLSTDCSTDLASHSQPLSAITSIPTGDTVQNEELNGRSHGSSISNTVQRPLDYDHIQRGLGKSIKFICHLCSETQKSEFLFRLHLATKHTGFRHTSELSLTDHGILLCPICWYVADSRADLAAHTGKHMNERQYCCSICPVVDSHNRRGIEKHIKTFHTVDNGAEIINRTKSKKVHLKPQLVDLDPRVHLEDVLLNGSLRG